MKKSKRKLALNMLAEILFIILFAVAIVIYYNNVIKKDISDLHYKITTGEEQEAVLEFRTARNEDEQWEARKTMARLEQIAAQEYGFTYADELHEKEIGRKGL